jgi:NodT family efflux transporter outer membrane factor (OMF) lipoprotein
MISFRRSLLAVLLAGPLVLIGCSMTPTMPTPAAEDALPSAYDTATPDTLLPAAARDTTGYDATRWWTVFDDPTLNAIIDTTLVGNLDLAAARARLEELQAQYRIARAPLFPSATANGRGQRQSQPANTGIGGAISGGGGNGSGNGGQSIPDRFAFTTYSVSLGLSYEIDFWGRLRSQKNAALSEFFATTADVQNTRLAIISQTISTYFQSVTLAQQVQLAGDNVQLLRDRLAITEDRYERGLTPSFELYAVRQQLEQARSNQPTLASQQYDAQSRLAVLLGRFAGRERPLLSDTAPDSLMLAPIPAGLPSDLLMQRPDVMAAAARLEATRQRIGVARANLLPGLSLTAEGGTQSSDLSSLLDLDQRFTNFIASLTAPLFQGGALWAEVDASKARYRQQLATYENTLLTAFQEVKASLVAYQQEEQRYRRVQDQLAAAEATAQNQRDRFQRGIGDALALLDAEQNLVQVRQRLATVAQALIEARLAVHRALGGAWTDAPPPDDPRLFQ